MLDQLLPFAEYLRGKKFYLILRESLNLIFTISITSFFFELIYFKYELLNIDDYKGIIDFFTRGSFFVPFVLFFLIWMFTYLISYSVFFGFNFLYSQKLIKKINNFSLKSLSIDEKKSIEDRLKKNIEEQMPILLKDKWYFKVYSIIKTNSTQKDYQDFLKGMNLMKETVTSNFIMIFRGLLAILIYFFTQPYFGITLLIIVIILWLIMTLLYSFQFLFASLMPSVLMKIYIEFERKLKEENFQRSEKTSE